MKPKNTIRTNSGGDIQTGMKFANLLQFFLTCMETNCILIYRRNFENFQNFLEDEEKELFSSEISELKELLDDFISGGFVRNSTKVNVKEKIRATIKGILESIGTRHSNLANEPKVQKNNLSSKFVKPKVVKGNSEECRSSQDQPEDSLASGFDSTSVVSKSKPLSIYTEDAVLQEPGEIEEVKLNDNPSQSHVVRNGSVGGSETSCISDIDRLHLVMASPICETTSIFPSSDGGDSSPAMETVGPNSGVKSPSSFGFELIKSGEESPRRKENQPYLPSAVNFLENVVGREQKMVEKEKKNSSRAPKNVSTFEDKKEKVDVSKIANRKSQSNDSIIPDLEEIQDGKLYTFCDKNEKEILKVLGKTIKEGWDLWIKCDYRQLWMDMVQDYFDFNNIHQTGLNPIREYHSIYIRCETLKKFKKKLHEFMDLFEKLPEFRNKTKCDVSTDFVVWRDTSKKIVKFFGEVSKELELNGIGKLFDEKTGNLRHFGYFSRGKRHGPGKEYSESGKLFRVGFWSNGEYDFSRLFKRVDSYSSHFESVLILKREHQEEMEKLRRESKKRMSELLEERKEVEIEKKTIENEKKSLRVEFKRKKRHIKEKLKLEIENRERENEMARKLHRFEGSLIEKTFKDYEIVECIGRGPSSAVFKVKLGGKNLAIKTLFNYFEGLSVKKDLLPEFPDRLPIHDNILRIHHCFVGTFDKRRIRDFFDESIVKSDTKLGCVVMSLCETSLYHYTREGRSSHLRIEKDFFQFLLQIARGLDVLKKNGFIHRDICPNNILINDGKFLISDFGMCLDGKKYPDFKIQNFEGVLGGSEYYMPSEIKDRSDYGSGRYLFFDKYDIYSLGVVCWELFTKRKVSESSKLTEKECESEEIRKIVEKMLFPYEKRYTIEELLKTCEIYLSSGRSKKATTRCVDLSFFDNNGKYLIVRNVDVNTPNLTLLNRICSVFGIGDPSRSMLTLTNGKTISSKFSYSLNDFLMDCKIRQKMVFLKFIAHE